MELMGKKMEASLAIEGKFSEEGLLAMTSGEDMTTALAKTLVEGLNSEGAESIWQKLNEKNSIYRSEEVVEDFDDVQKVQVDNEVKKSADDVIETGLDSERVVYVDFLTFGRKNGKIKKRVSVRADEIESIDAGDNVGPAQFSMFE